MLQKRKTFGKWQQHGSSRTLILANSVKSLAISAQSPYGPGLNQLRLILLITVKKLLGASCNVEGLNELGTRQIIEAWAEELERTGKMPNGKSLKDFLKNEKALDKRQ